MKPIYLTNTLTKRKEEFKPIKAKRLTFYSCGPTVYDYPHIGNMRFFIVNDIIKRAFLYNGYKVKHIINLTDVGHLTSNADFGEDKMEKAKQREGKTAWDIAKFYTAAFKHDCQQVNTIPPTKYVKATSCIKEQIKLIELLEQKGFTYQTSDGIYFDTSKYQDYGKLGKINLTNIQTGARVEMNREKKNKTDFALWKFSPKNVNRDMEWRSPWGIGFPGWHLECSVISTKNLGQPFDLHTGGIEHIPIHHNNEIAQSKAAYNKPLANFWLHLEHLNLASGKMSKSSGDFITIHSLLEKNIDPLAFRYFVLQTHYAKRILFSWEALQAAANGFKNLQYQISQIKGKGKINQDYQNKFITAINDNFNTPQALAFVWEILKDQKLTEPDKKATILSFDKVLGLKLDKIKTIKIPTAIKTLAEERWQAKVAKDWNKSDQLRKDLEKKGYLIEDNIDSYIITKK